MFTRLQGSLTFGYASSSIGLSDIWLCNTVVATKKRCRSKTFSFFFVIDPTVNDGNVGRMVNNSRNAVNAQPKIINEQGFPHLAIFADRKIFAGEQILYDYGERRRNAVADKPWLRQ